MRATSPPLTEPAPASPETPRNSRTVALIVAAAMFMEQLDGTVLATALPTMSRELRRRTAVHERGAHRLSVEPGGAHSGERQDRRSARLAHRVPRRDRHFYNRINPLRQAPSLPILVGARMLQGVGGAMMLPVGRLILLRAVPRSELVRAMAWLMVPATHGPDPRAAGRRIHHHLPELAVDFLHQRADRPGRDRAGHPLCRGDARATRRPVRCRGMVLSGMALSCLMFEPRTRRAVVWARRGIKLALVVGVACAATYWRHARHHPHPMLDFRLMRIPTFRLSVVCGTLSRISVGAMPFLLPMMLQFGFGLSAAQSGLITFIEFGRLAGHALRGALIPAPARLPQRARLVRAGRHAAAGADRGLPAELAPGGDLPGAVREGFFQSLQFMAYNTIAYADVPAPRMSAATSFYTTFQQMSLTLGIAVSAAALAASRRLMGHASRCCRTFPSRC